MIKIKVNFGTNIFNATWQDKTFKTEMDAVEWCRRNYAKIWIINDYQTLGQPIPHFEIMDAIRGIAR